MNLLNLLLLLHNLTWLTLIAVAGLILPSLPEEAADLAAEISGAPQLLARLRRRCSRFRHTRNSAGLNRRRFAATNASDRAAAGPTGD